MPAMPDIGPTGAAILAFVLGGLFTTIVTLVGEEIRASRDHKRGLEQMRAGRAMDIRLGDIEATRWDLRRITLRRIDRLEGKEIDRSVGKPTGNITVELVGDADLYGRLRAFWERLGRLEPGSGLTDEVRTETSQIMLDLDIAMDAQREAVLSGRPVRIIGEADLRRLLGGPAGSAAS